MLNRQKISRDLNKIQKLWAEKGTNTVVRKIFHLATKKIGQSAIKRTLDRRDLLLKNLEMDTLTQDLENILSKGLLRPLDEVRTDVRLTPPEYMETIVNEARRILKNEFIIYGSQKVSYEPEQFSWTLDPLTGFVWPKSRLDNNGRIRKPYGTDVKTIWEIARFQFLSSLAYAYILTGEKKYARFAIEKMNSWIDENLFLNRPHWWMPMESSIRLINWCVYLPLLNIFEYAGLSLKTKITLSIFEHLVYIKENLEVSPSQGGNHYLADLVGLLTARLLFPTLEWAFECREFAKTEFEREIQNQFKESGINFEGSIAYHRLSFEMCLMGVALIKKMGLIISSDVSERLKQMADFTKYYTSVSKNCPIIGDNDSGVYLKYFPGQEGNQHRYLNCLFGAILENKAAPNNFEEFLCSIHFANTRPPYSYATDKRKKAGDTRLQVKEFDGLIIARNKHEAIFFNTLQSTEGHTHNDKLAVYPVIGDKLLFLDRGSFSYTGFWRKRHEDRMTSSHNGPLINGWEQSSIWKNSLYYNNGEAKCFNSLENDGNIVSITGWHFGYGRFSKGLKVFRQIRWNTKERSFLITDWIEGINSTEMFKFELYFLINPIWSIKVANGCFMFNHQEKRVIFEDTDRIGFKQTKGYYCPNYQIEKPCDALKASTKIRVGDKVRYRLRY